MQAAQAGLQRAVEKQRGLEAQVSEQQGHARGLQRELIRCVCGGGGVLRTLGTTSSMLLQAGW